MAEKSVHSAKREAGDAEFKRIDELIDAGICGICESSPIHGDDLFCESCRSDLDATCDTVVDPVERLLSQHQHMCQLSDMDETLCRCGQTFEGGPAFHRVHMAQEIYKALGLEGPQPWIFGPLSNSPNHSVSSAVSDG